MLVVQLVEILWTKKSRGIPGADLRAALPRQFGIEPGEAPYVFQHLCLAEWRDFSPVLVKNEARSTVPRTEGSLYLRADDPAAVRLGLLGQASGGQPRRHSVMQAITMRPGEFSRLVINGRHTSYSGQWYSELVYNVAYGQNIASGRFLQGEPDHRFSLQAHLF